MCDCDKIRQPADTAHPTYKSVIKRKSRARLQSVLSKKQNFS